MIAVVELQLLRSKHKRNPTVFKARLAIDKTFD
jgi:hypothetical protein